MVNESWKAFLKKVAAATFSIDKPVLWYSWKSKKNVLISIRRMQRQTVGRSFQADCFHASRKRDGNSPPESR